MATDSERLDKLMNSVRAVVDEWIREQDISSAMAKLTICWSEIDSERQVSQSGGAK